MQHTLCSFPHSLALKSENVTSQHGYETQTSQPTNKQQKLTQPANQPANQPVSRPVSQSVNQSTAQLLARSYPTQTVSNQTDNHK